MGMGGALAAFFGVPLGGSLFALEVCSRFGVEYFEHMIETIFCGEVCLVVFRSLSGLPIKPIWDMTALSGRLIEVTPSHVLLGGAIGLYGAFWAYVFALLHWRNMAMFEALNLLDNCRAVYRGWLAAVVLVFLSILIPYTGEETNWR
jgi:H+/Cl- antiporter ClcA